MSADGAFMKHALALGRRGLGRVWPNPAVGCIIVREGRIVGRGWTQDGGRPHAETEALAQAGAAASGATAYVTLEPCAHHGKTPPCCDALIAAGIARVVVAAEDPDERVAGNGLAKMRSAGIDVHLGQNAEEAYNSLKGYMRNRREGRPWLTLKLATSLDGRIATASGESRWITGPAARAYVHGMRARHDAVMVGAGTAQADDPSLTVRDLGVNWQPVRVVLSRRAGLPLDSQLVRTATETPVWLCHGESTNETTLAPLREAGVELLACGTSGAHLSPYAVLEELGAAGLTRVFCEGGGTLAASLLGAGVVDELVTMTAGIGIGAEGQPGLGAMGLAELAEAPRLELVETRPIGGDVLSRWERTR